ncbi:hypothetical protein C2E23DRAFT_862673 [Lenzites betulinus]|nr:hypothetical protein C2E23DRAFT_862673 [Lenzites betulinus]
MSNGANNYATPSFPTQSYMEELVSRQLRLVRAFVIPLTGPAGIRTVPVANASIRDGPGIDYPLLSDVWTVQGIVDERSIPVAFRLFGGFGGRGCSWELFSVWYLLPTIQHPPVNPFVQQMDIPPVTGEFIILRRTMDGRRLLDVRRVDYTSVELFSSRDCLIKTAYIRVLLSSSMHHRTDISNPAVPRLPTTP